jgi:hypothetical protein
MDLVFGAQDELGIGPVNRFVGIDSVALFKGTHARIHGLHDTGGIKARYKRKRSLAVAAVSDIGIGRIYTDGFRPDKDLSGTGFRIGDFFELKDVRAPKSVYADGFH